MIQFREAKVEDDPELTRLVAKPMPGDLSLSMARDPSFLRSCARCGPPRRVLVAEKQGELMAVCTHFLWKYRVLDEVREIWTAADFRAESRAAGLSVTGLGWRALRDRLEGKPALISLVKDNPLSFKLFSKRRKGWPALHEVAQLQTLMLPLAAIPKLRPKIGLFQPVSSQICELNRLDKRHLRPELKEEDIGRVTPGEESFLAQHDGVGLSACGALWDLSEYRQIKIAGYGGLYAKLKRWCAPILPEKGSQVRVSFASFLRGTCRNSLGNVFQGLVLRARERGSQFLVWGGDISEDPPFPKYWPHFRMESTLFQLRWKGDEQLPRGFCGYEVAWL
ncbi:MAG: hypothetical protein KC800_02465 [Candidatus Eremiobacteraeota bacterium]|nr:hypothetical protein [Candidatus Eremiobacteraeota bacterium]